jgi:hypothetical protein
MWAWAHYIKARTPEIIFNSHHNLIFPQIPQTNTHYTMTESGKIFNVDSENIGSEYAYSRIFTASPNTVTALFRHKTTAAAAQIDAPTRKVAAQVEENADRAKQAAKQTAVAAKVRSRVWNFASQEN